ncbi:hypothetical protein AB0F88_22455 [Streptosporangium sp. NPDC023963]|uniref:hypothetical protein n=1 Tax=Streptosporangium sp. NPDC023963 TaxID=3155608 RepID=UPI0034468043
MNSQIPGSGFERIAAKVLLLATATVGVTAVVHFALFAEVLSWALPTVGVLSAGVVLMLAVDVARGRRQRLAQAEEDPGEALRRRVERVNEAFVEAAALMADLQRDLAAQQAAREELIAQAEEQQQLLTVDQEQAKNIRLLLIEGAKEANRAERGQQWMFFLLGTLVSVPIGVAINVFVP